MSERFAADWLALREPFDAAARDVGLARRLAAALPARPVVLDLGAGSGSLFRWLAPVIGRAQVWLLADADEELLLTRLRRHRTLGGRARLDSDAGPSGAAGAHAGRGVAGGGVPPRSGADAPPLDAADVVVCSALLDLVSAAWLERLVATLSTPLLACLNVDGRDAFLPRHPLDAAVRGGFRADQGRDKGFGPALGPCAPAALHAALAAAGFAAASAPSDWRIPRSALAMLGELVRRPCRGGGAGMPGAPAGHRRLA